ncbi:MAG TPA: hypothetical protein VD833_09990 [Vicinamibacterales bacterium]|nr:hypothetical protein [Vicinamibacterales bacterium]
MKPSEQSPAGDNTAPSVEPPAYRPIERFWPYADLPEQPSDEELARLDPDLAEALFGTPRRAFSISLEFPVFEGPGYTRALELARASAEYRQRTENGVARHRARFHPQDARQLRDLFEIVGRLDATEVLVDDRPVPYARELWLPLLWLLIP